MQPPTIDPDLFPEGPPPNRAERRASEAKARHLPDIHERPRRRLPLMVVAAGAFLAAGIAFYGAEALLPREYKPSSFIGGYANAISEATKRGELTAQINYEHQLRTLELTYQDGFHRIQTAAVQWQEQCRAGLLNVTNHYQSALQQANILAQGVVQLQQSYTQMRNQIINGTLGGETAIINLVMTVLPFVAMVDPQAARQLERAAQQGRAQMLATFDRMSRGGNTVSVRGWDSSLPRPDAFRSMIRCDAPTFRTGVSTAPLTPPAAPAQVAPARAR